MDEKITYNLREEWVEKYLSKIASVMMEASEHAETVGEVMLMRKFSEVVENYLSFNEEGDPDEAIRN